MDTPVKTPPMTEGFITQSYMTSLVSHAGRRYTLGMPLDIVLEQEEGYLVASNTVLDIYGTGHTRKEAEESLFQEFDHIYTTYNALEDGQLSARLLEVKRQLNAMVQIVS